MTLAITSATEDEIRFLWEECQDVDYYRVSWKDSKRGEVIFLPLIDTKEHEYTWKQVTHKTLYVKVEAFLGERKVAESDIVETPIKKVYHPQLEKLGRGLIAVRAEQGIFLAWRMHKAEVTGACKMGLTGADYKVYRNGQQIAYVTDSTNYLDPEGQMEDTYAVAAVMDGEESVACEAVKPWQSGSNYIDIPLQKPADGVTPAGEPYTYHANDMSVGDVDGDGEYEYIVKWDPSNSHDVSIKGYTGKCFIDCIKLDGRLLWRLDMGVNIRAGAHYTQFMVYDFNRDGKAEMAVKTAPGTKMIWYDESGKVVRESYISLLQEDVEAGVTQEDNYVCSAEKYHEHLVNMFTKWQDNEEVKQGVWPKTLEECFGIPVRYSYPLTPEDAEELVQYFIKEYAPKRSGKNHLEAFEGFIYEGPEYLTMFAGDGSEMETIRYPYGRVDDGLRWGDYSMNRIEPCNRVDRFLAGVAYLDGENPYLIMCRGYYTRTTIAAYDFFDNTFREKFCIDSGFVSMSNPFADHPHEAYGTDPVYGCIAGQGNHSLSTADVDGDGCQEIIYGAACIDHDGSVLYSSEGYLPDGTKAKYGHGDAMHVCKINPNRPGLQIFNVFEGATAAPYGYALRDARTGEALFGEYAEEDLGRCMIGDIDPKTPGLQVWVNDVYDCDGKKLDVPVLSTNQCIRWAADLTTQVIDWSDYLHGQHVGIINDTTHGIMLQPEGTATNNGTKGNPCLVADLFGDFREELVLRLEDDSAIRIYTNTEVTKHKLYNMMEDVQYRTGIAWQNNCYNQPGYVSYYYASDMDFSEIL